MITFPAGRPGKFRQSLTLLPLCQPVAPRFYFHPSPQDMSLPARFLYSGGFQRNKIPFNGVECRMYLHAGRRK
jgi:hypothetical protein